MINHLGQEGGKGSAAGIRPADVPGFVLAQLVGAAQGGRLGQ